MLARAPRSISFRMRLRARLIRLAMLLSLAVIATGLLAGCGSTGVAPVEVGPLITVNVRGGMCMEGACVGINCANGIKNPGEGDIDCGGNCLPCDDGKTCTNGSQCKSGVCTGGMCAVPSCMDAVKNGKETGFDCGGGECPPCPTDDSCLLPTDCQSGVCVDVFCAAPSCTDALQNGDEAGIDCGGTCPNACP